MKDYPSLDRIADLQQMIADFAKVIRVPQLADTGRGENDVEHSFGLALTCWYLQPKIAPELDLLQILQYSLAHDIVELHAGDTFVFDNARLADKLERETEAVEQIAEEWSDFPDLASFAKGYMDKISPEARFVKAVDKLLPILMIELGEGAAFWDKHKITLDMERENKTTIQVSEVMSPYYDKLITWLDNRGHMYTSR